MKFGNELDSKIGRFLTYGLFLLFLLGIIESVLDEEISFSDFGIFGVTMGCLFLGFLINMKYQASTGKLTEDGVYVRHFFIKRFYRWSDIQQAGILSRNGKTTYYEIILVKPGGYPLTPQTKYFFLKNLFRLIHIPYSEPLRHYIISCYGPLDFDQYHL